MEVFEIRRWTEVIDGTTFRRVQGVAADGSVLWDMGFAQDE